MIPLLFEPEWLKTLIECAKSDEKIGIVGPRLCNQGSVNSISQDTRQLPRYIMPDGQHINIWPSNNKVTPCTYVVGACFLVKRQLIHNIGPFR